VEEILKGQVIIRSRAFVTFSATEFSRAARKDLAGRMWPAGRMLCRPGLGYFKLGAIVEGFGRLTSYKFTLHVLVTFTKQVVPIHKLYLLYSEFPGYQEQKQSQ